MHPSMSTSTITDIIITGTITDIIITSIIMTTTTIMNLARRMNMTIALPASLLDNYRYPSR
jgi:hypothetical protein